MNPAPMDAKMPGTDTTISTTLTVGLTLSTNVTTVTSAGAVDTNGATAVYGPPGTAWTLVNQGSIADAGTASAYGVSLAAGGSVGNAASAVIAGYAGGIHVEAAAGTVANSGTVAATGPHGAGIALYAGGSVSNAAGGTVSGAYGVQVAYGAAGTVTNAGLVSATQGQGVFLGSGGSVANSGTVAAAAGAAAELDGGGSLNNTGLLSGTVAAYFSSGGTLTNAGTLAGTSGTAVRFAGTGADRVVAAPGAVFAGTVAASASAASAVLELASGSGSLSNFGTQFIGFSGITLDSSAAWTVTGLAVIGATQTLSGTGTIAIASGATLDVKGAVNAGVGIAFASDTRTLQIDNIAQFNGTVLGFAADDVIDLTGVPDTNLTVGTDATNHLTVTSAGTLVASIQLDPSASYSNVTFATAPDSGAGTLITEVTCFTRGTRIATADGFAAVEDLRIGDAVLTESGRAQPVIWIGRRRIDCTRHPAPHKAWPVRIAAGAFGEAMPERDLFISPAHSIYIDNVFIPVKYLINGSTITQQKVETVEYYHVELQSHDVLLSEGLPTESYLENGDRHTFENGRDVISLYPDMASPWAWEADSYAPLMLVGPVVEAVKARLAERARQRAAA